MPRTVLFLCTANMYRSRLAEILFNHYARATGLDWIATSRAIADPRGLSGMSRLATAYLEGRGLIDEPPQPPRDPLPLTTDEFERADLAVGLCRAEHESQITNRFIGLARARAADNRLIFWNVYDARIRYPWPLSLLAWMTGHPVQPAASGTEHIDFATRALVGQLLDTDNPAPKPL